MKPVNNKKSFLNGPNNEGKPVIKKMRDLFLGKLSVALHLSSIISSHYGLHAEYSYIRMLTEPKISTLVGSFW